MKRQLRLNKEFEKWLNVPFFTDDANAYELVYNLGEKGKGCHFKVTAKRADGVCITDIGEVSDNGIITYTLASNMYGVEGTLEIRVQVLDGETALTENIIYANVKKGENGTENPSTSQHVINKIIINLNGKVDKVDGKGLSANDYTDAEKEKLAGLENYDDSAIKQDIVRKVDKTTGYGLAHIGESIEGNLNRKTYKTIYTRELHGDEEVEQTVKIPAYMSDLADDIGLDKKEDKDELNLKLYGTTDVYTLTGLGLGSANIQKADIWTDGTKFIAQTKEVIKHDVVIIPEGIEAIEPAEPAYNEETEKYYWPDGAYPIKIEARKIICPSTLVSLKASTYATTSIEGAGHNIEFKGEVILNGGLETINLDDEATTGSVDIGDLSLPSTIKDFSSRYHTRNITIPADIEKFTLSLTAFRGNLYVYNANMDFLEADLAETENYGGTIYGYIGSTAEKFAKEKGIRFVNIGIDYSKQIETITEGIEENRQNIAKLENDFESVRSEIGALALRGTKSGSVVGITDISHIEHNIAVSVRTNESMAIPINEFKLVKCGKNLFNSDTNLIKEIDFYNTDENEIKRVGYQIFLPEGTYTIKTTPKTSVTNHYIYGGVCDVNMYMKQVVQPVVGGILNTITFTIDYDEHLILYAGDKNVMINGAKTLFGYYDIQIEEGENATEFEPYIEPVIYDVSEDGIVKGVTSIYPNTTLYAEPQGATLEAQYNRDINKVFVELQNAIISLGGEI